MPEIILLRGRPGVGKTTISNQLSSRLNLPVIRKDDFYDATAAYLKDHEQRNKICYGILFQFLETNKNVEGRWILDFPFNREDEMIRFKSFLNSQGYMLSSVLCVCSDETVWAERFNQRKQNPLPNQLITDFTELKAYYGNLSIQSIQDELTVDTVETLDSILEKIMSFIHSQ
ncbi:AAA family ATPase [Paenibacillus sp. RC67]|uniref:AAA family ATPase n=1 Tax=Paenibacillus sp. RC67 TaxID=3039392 RepID=UPI0024AD7B14|nr:AAA family ATPase [Paenibacillus sp. RC67]